MLEDSQDPLPPFDCWVPLAGPLTFRTISFSPITRLTRTPPRFPPSFGWLWPSHKVVMRKLIDERTRCILELGSFLGKSTTFLSELAPNAVIYAVDLWDNEFLMGDSTYNASEENLSLLRHYPLYETFLANLWKHR